MTTVDPSELGGLLRVERLRRKWSQRQLAAHFGLSETVVCHWEIGRQPVSPTRYPLLGEFLSVDILAPRCVYCGGELPLSNLRRKYCSNKCNLFERKDKTCETEGCDALVLGVSTHCRSHANTAERHPGWMEVKRYAAMHQRIKRVRGKASALRCFCGVIAVDWAYDHQDPDETAEVVDKDKDNFKKKSPNRFSQDPFHYVALCRGHHMALDHHVAMCPPTKDRPFWAKLWFQMFYEAHDLTPDGNPLPDTLPLAA